MGWFLVNWWGDLYRVYCNSESFFILMLVAFWNFVSKYQFYICRVDDGRLPLQFACDGKKPYVDLAIALVKHGADISIRYSHGNVIPSSGTIQNQCLQAW